MSLSVRIVTGLILGILVGLFVGEKALAIQWIGEVWIRLMQIVKMTPLNKEFICIQYFIFLRIFV